MKRIWIYLTSLRRRYLYLTDISIRNINICHIKFVSMCMNLSNAYVRHNLCKLTLQNSTSNDKNFATKPYDKITIRKHKKLKP